MNNQYTALFKQLTNYTASDAQDPKEQPDNAKLWEMLLDVASQSDNLQIYFEVFSHYLNLVPEFRSTPCQRLLDTMAKGADKSIKAEERAKIVLPLFIALPFTTCENAVQIIKSAIAIADDLMKEKNDIPTQYIENFDDILLDAIEVDYVPEILKAFKDSIEGDMFVAGLLCFAPVVADACRMAPEMISDYIAYIAKAFEGELLSKAAGCRFIDFLCDYFMDDMEVCPPLQQLLDFVLPLMNESNINCVKIAYHALCAMVDAHVFPEEDVDAILALLDKFTTPTAYKYFFKILRIILSPDDDSCDCGDECCEHHHDDDGEHVNLQTVQKLLTFSVETIKSDKSNLIKSHCFDLLADIASLDKDYIEDSYQEVFAVAKKFIDENQYETYPWITAFHIIGQEYFPMQTKENVKQIITAVISNINNEAVGDKKLRYIMFTDVCHLIGKGGSDEHIQEATRIALEILNDSDIKFVSHGCAATICLLPKLSPESAATAFETVSTRAKQTESSEELNQLMETLNQLLEKFSIPHEKVEPLIKAILTGDMKTLNGMKPVDIIPSDGSYFVFLASYIRKYPLPGAEVCNTLIQWLEANVEDSIEMVLEPLSAGVEACAVKEDGAKKIVSIIKEYISKLSPHEISIVEPALDCLTAINQSYPSTLKPVDDIFNYLTEAVQHLAETGEEEDFEYEGVQAMPTVAKFVFNVYANDAEVEVNEDLLGSLVSMMPFTPEFEGTSELLQCLVDMLSDQERFESIVLVTLKMFTELLLLKKTELQEFNIDDEVLKAMKDTLKQICKKKPAIAKQITKEFQSSRSKVNRFNTLIR